MQTQPDKPIRIAVIGTTGSGKTTLARQLSKRLGVPHIELDALHWGPNWTPAPTTAMRERVAEALSAPSWVVDGNYSIVRDIVWHTATIVVWLDYPLGLTAWRLLKRTLRRAITREAFYSGNRESLRTAFFSRDSILLWMVQTHGKHRREYPLVLAQPEHAHLQIVRLQSPRQAKEWLMNLVISETQD